MGSMHFWGGAPRRPALVDVTCKQQPSRGKWRRFWACSSKLAFAALLVVGLLLADMAAAGADWIMPIEAPVVDPFRPPSTRFGSGNRGLEFGETEGLSVVSVDAGRVTFAGRIGQHRYVVVDHGQGLRSTYAYLTTVSVVRGQAVHQGTRIGVAGSGFHLTARLGEVYVDPALLVAGAAVVVQLTENDLPIVRAGATNSISTPSESRIRRWFSDAAVAVVGGAERVIVGGAERVIVGGAERVVDGTEWVAERAESAAIEVSDRIVSGAEWTADTAADLAREVYERSEQLVDNGFAALPDLFTDPIRAVTEWHHEECTDLSGGRSPSSIQAASDVDSAEINGTGQEVVARQAAGSGRILIQVGGLGSNDGDASIGGLDAEGLGYNTNDIIGFSYGGGCTPKPFDRDVPQGGSLTEDLSSPTARDVDSRALEAAPAAGESVHSSTYDAKDTLQDLHLSAERLADLVEAAAEARPGQPIDIAAHSLGGVVTRLALEKLEQRRVAGTLQTGAMPNVVITIGSPHSGVDQGFGTQMPSGLPASPAERALSPIWEELGSIGQISNGSPTELDPPSDPPDGVTVIAVAGNVDLIVPSVVAIWDEATNVIVLSDLDGSALHGELPGHPDVASELELALRGLPPRCVALADLLGSAILGTAISEAEKRVASLFGMQRWLL